jgi:hypothetical protein
VVGEGGEARGVVVDVFGNYRDMLLAAGARARKRREKRRLGLGATPSRLPVQTSLTRANTHHAINNYLV